VRFGEAGERRYTGVALLEIKRLSLGVGRGRHGGGEIYRKSGSEAGKRADVTP
jgi:hypothetical protein